MGGYTALALAGGTPRTREGKRIETTPDQRIKAIVLLAPGAGWFTYGLDHVTIPILLLTAEHDPITPAWNAETVLKSIPDESLVTFRQIANAGHFSLKHKNTNKKGTQMLQKFLLETELLDFGHPEMIKKSLQSAPGYHADA